MKFMRLTVVLDVLLVSGAALAQTLPEDVAKKVDTVFEKWDRAGSPLGQTMPTGASHPRGVLSARSSEFRTVGRQNKK